jgi:D-alanyl-lipoteichoic acid acyltransferase DltB (MBOAT superfamily)
MNFNTPQYAVLLTVVFWLYWLLRRNDARLLLLLVASYLFYSAWSPTYLLLLAGCTLFQWAVGWWIGRAEDVRRRRWLLALSVAGGLGALSVFKYFNFFITETDHLLSALGLPFVVPRLGVLLPVGISFYTFHTLSYTIDVYRRKAEPTRSLLQFAVFVAFFPLLVAGPILRASQFLPQLGSSRSLQEGQAMAGVQRILAGLVKKAIFADMIGATLVDPVFAAPAKYGGLGVVLAVYGYAIQIYSDFSGYSDIAIGSAKLLGYELPENFLRPYLATDLRDFWRRWHISLSTWLRDYLYIPLGGSRISPTRTQANLLLTMVLGGLWHGANWTFLIWGGIHGGMLAVNRWFQRRAEQRGGPPPRELPLWLRRFVTFHLVCLAWVFFRATNLAHAAQVLQALGAPPARVLAAGRLGILLVLLGLGLHFTPLEWKDRLVARYLALPAPAQALAAFMVICISAAAARIAAPFIYFRF